MVHRYRHLSNKINRVARRKAVGDSTIYSRQSGRLQNVVEQGVPGIERGNTYDVWYDM